MTFIGFSMAFIGSQLVGLLFAAITTTIAYELQAGSKFVWLFSASLIGSIAAAPFAGPLADLVGRKTISVVGVSASLLGMVLCGATNHVDGFIAGQVLVGAGVAIQELMSLCVIVELVPARRRGFYVALSISALIPFTPGPMYGQMIAQYNWRWNTLLVGIWNALTIAIILIFYQPPPRVNSFGLRRLEIVKRIDFLGGFLMAAGTLLFALGLNWGGQEYPWRSAQVICILVLSLVVFFAFGVWEVFGAKWPMYPRRVAQGRRAFFAIIFIIFVAGITYMPALIFWVMQIISVYDSSPAEVGVRILPFGICILSGSIICALLISAFKDHIRPLQVAFCALQTIGTRLLISTVSLLSPPY
jgi:MFS family permease